MTIALKPEDKVLVKVTIGGNTRITWRIYMRQAGGADFAVYDSTVHSNVEPTTCVDVTGYLVQGENSIRVEFVNYLPTPDRKYFDKAEFYVGQECKETELKGSYERSSQQGHYPVFSTSYFHVQKPSANPDSISKGEE
ncbi:MAG TPA: hypothetical protein VM658_00845 [bacterium]|nr:hypothetical protein [bacterium]